MTTVNRYTPEEILAIFQANYLQQQQFDPEVEPGEELTFGTTIDEWRNICDLLGPRELAEYFNYFFELDISVEKWISILQAEDVKTLKEVCEFIAGNAIKPSIKPIKLFGSDCQSAATFRYLIKKFEEKGAEIREIRPSSLLEPFAKKYFPLVNAEVNKLNPLALPPVVYKDNLIIETGFYICSIAFLLLIVSIWVSKLVLLTIVLFIVGYCLIWLGSRYEPREVSFEGIITFRDLLVKIQSNEK